MLIERGTPEYDAWIERLRVAVEADSARLVEAIGGRPYRTLRVWQATIEQAELTVEFEDGTTTCLVFDVPPPASERH